MRQIFKVNVSTQPLIKSGRNKLSFKSISGQFRKEEKKKGAKWFFSPVASRHSDLQPFRSQQSRRLTQMLSMLFSVEYRVGSAIKDVDKNNRSQQGCVPGTVVGFL